MKNITKTQWITIAMWIFYILYEIKTQLWIKDQTAAGAPIRVDLLLIFPFLIIFSVISIIQLRKNKK